MGAQVDCGQNTPLNGAPTGIPTSMSVSPQPREQVVAKSTLVTSAWWKDIVKNLDTDPQGKQIAEALIKMRVDNPKEGLVEFRNQIAKRQGGKHGSWELHQKYNEDGMGALKAFCGVTKLNVAPGCPLIVLDDKGRTHRFTTLPGTNLTGQSTLVAVDVEPLPLEDAASSGSPEPLPLEDAASSGSPDPTVSAPFVPPSLLFVEHIAADGLFTLENDIKGQEAARIKAARAKFCSTELPPREFSMSDDHDDGHDRFVPTAFDKKILDMELHQKIDLPLMEARWKGMKEEYKKERRAKKTVKKKLQKSQQIVKKAQQIVSTLNSSIGEEEDTFTDLSWIHRGGAVTLKERAGLDALMDLFGTPDRD